MHKWLLPIAKCRLAIVADSVSPGSVVVGILGLALLIGEATALSARGIPDIAAPLAAVFLAAILSSIAG